VKKMAQMDMAENNDRGAAATERRPDNHEIDSSCASTAWRICQAGNLTARAVWTRLSLLGMVNRQWLRLGR
jgi:hypothetical protein